MVATNRAGVKELRGIARNCARRRTVGEPGEEGRVVRTFRERRRWVARQRERQQLGDGVLDECEAEGERVADESVLIGEERAQVVAVAERQGGFVDGGDGRRHEGELDGEEDRRRPRFSRQFLDRSIAAEPPRKRVARAALRPPRVRQLERR